MNQLLKKQFGTKNDMLHTHDQAVNFEINTRFYDEEGMLDFFWPVSYTHRREFAETYLSNLKTFFDSLSEIERSEAEVFFTFQTQIFVIVATLAQDSLLKSAIKRTDPQFPAKRSLCWSAMSAEAWLWDYQKKMFPSFEEPIWKRYGRYAKYLLKRGGIKSIPVQLAAKRFPVITGISPLLEQFLVQENIRTAVYVHYSAWFFPFSPKETESSNVKPISDDLLKRYIAAIPKIGDHDISAERIIALGDFIKRVSYIVKQYLYRLERKPNLVPSYLLSGSLGMAHNSMLALAVRRSGGKVIAFDHGFSCNIWSSSTTAFVETQLCNEFHTFSKHSASAIIKNMERHCFSSRLPQILSYQMQEKKEVISAQEGTSKDGKTIMFVQALFIGDQGELDPIMPNVVAADWQVRLFYKLKSLGFNIILKPHPLSATQLPQHVLSDLGIKIAHDSFERVCMNADILMFDYAFTTTFHLGMLTDKPIVYFNFSDAEYPENLVEYLNNRIEIVCGTYDADNRAQINFECLSEAIDKAKSKKDQEIVKQILPNFVHY